MCGTHKHAHFQNTWNSPGYSETHVNKDINIVDLLLTYSANTMDESFLQMMDKARERSRVAAEKMRVELANQRSLLVDVSLHQKQPKSASS
jgi:hypothetical protein